MISGDFSAAWNMGSPARGPAGGQNAADGLGLSRPRPLRLAALLMLAMAPGLARARGDRDGRGGRARSNLVSVGR